MDTLFNSGGTHHVRSNVCRSAVRPATPESVGAYADLESPVNEGCDARSRPSTESSPPSPQRQPPSHLSMSGSTTGLLSERHRVRCPPTPQRRVDGLRGEKTPPKADFGAPERPQGPSQGSGVGMSPGVGGVFSALWRWRSRRSSWTCRDSIIPSTSAAASSGLFGPGNTLEPIIDRSARNPAFCGHPFRVLDARNFKPGTKMGALDVFVGERHRGVPERSKFRAFPMPEYRAFATRGEGNSPLQPPWNQFNGESKLPDDESMPRGATGLRFSAF